MARKTPRKAHTYRAARRTAVIAAARRESAVWHPDVWRLSPLRIPGAIKDRPLRDDRKVYAPNGDREVARRLKQRRA